MTLATFYSCNRRTSPSAPNADGHIYFCNANCCQYGNNCGPVAKPLRTGMKSKPPPQAPGRRLRHIHWEARRRSYATWLAEVLTYQWLDRSFSPEARRHLPALLLRLYVADVHGASVTMRQACEIMGVDFRNTGPRYVRLAQERGLLTIVERPAEDRRKTLLRATDKLRKLVSYKVDGLLWRLKRELEATNKGASEAEKAVLPDEGPAVKPSLDVAWSGAKAENEESHEN